jgi:hypothetical protein
MLDFSTLPKMVLLLVRLICFFLSGLLALIMCIVLWARHGSTGFALEPGDSGTLILVAILLAVALGLAWASGREMKRMPGK